jgi:hypothetical protein
MRCSKCDKTIKYAGKIARHRRICGSCWYAIMTISKDCLNNSIMMKNQCKTRKLP